MTLAYTSAASSWRRWRTRFSQVAVAWQIYAITRSPLALGYVGLTQFLPIAALFLFAGDIADRYNRQRILAISYAAQVLAAAFCSC